jgi:hypothetical protein
MDKNKEDELLEEAEIKDIVKDFQNVLDGKPSHYWDIHDEDGNLEKPSEMHGRRLGEDDDNGS